MAPITSPAATLGRRALRWLWNSRGGAYVLVIALSAAVGVLVLLAAWAVAGHG